jgi:hypothetical protein
MSTASKQSFLVEEIALLVRHFGVKRVQSALAKVATEVEDGPTKPVRNESSRAQRPFRASGLGAIESIRETDPKKHLLLSEFLLRLKNRQVLPESQDIRHFAQKIGLKEISGKSREDMIPKLIRFLVDQPIEKLRGEIEGASEISERQRQMGFSVLTDKLLGKS